ncbi:MAG: hypothetical protein CSB46_11265 [Micrococcales bacterium]|nr:MAG: hypothetical protein CSB46_11265 [Micrococcales bacterium]
MPTRCDSLLHGLQQRGELLDPLTGESGRNRQLVGDLALPERFDSGFLEPVGSRLIDHLAATEVGGHHAGTVDALDLIGQLLRVDLGGQFPGQPPVPADEIRAYLIGTLLVQDRAGPGLKVPLDAAPDQGCVHQGQQQQTQGNHQPRPPPDGSVDPEETA